MLNFDNPEAHNSYILDSLQNEDDVLSEVSKNFNLDIPTIQPLLMKNKTGNIKTKSLPQMNSKNNEEKNFKKFLTKTNKLDKQNIIFRESFLIEKFTALNSLEIDNDNDSSNEYPYLIITPFNQHMDKFKSNCNLDLLVESNKLSSGPLNSSDEIINNDIDFIKLQKEKSDLYSDEISFIFLESDYKEEGIKDAMETERELMKYLNDDKENVEDNNTI